MEWSTGTRRLKKYKTKEDSIKDCQRVWNKGYSIPPTLKDAQVWTGNDKPKTWLRIVKTKLNIL